MRTLVSLFVLCCIYTAVAAEDIESATFSVTVSGHKIEAVLSSKSFDPQHHKIIVPPRGSSEGARIDGKSPIGTDLTADARTEFSRFEVR